MMLNRPLSTAAALAALALAASALPAPQDRQQEFVKRMAQAMSINDYDEAAKLVRTYQNEAVVQADVLCSQLPEGTSEKLEREIDFLNKAWKASMKTNFVELHYTYLSLMSGPTYRERQRLRKEYIAQRGKYAENVAGPKDKAVFELAAGNLRGLAGSLEEVGASYLAGEAWIFYALCFNEENRGNDADKRKLVEGYEGMIRNWDAIELHYAQYFSVKEHYDRLVAEGWKEALDDPDAPPPGAPKEAAAATALTMTFEPVDKISSFERPNYFLDEMYQMWPSAYLQGKGSSASIASMEQGPLILRQESSSLGIDYDRDGNPESELKLTGKMTVVEFDMHDDGPVRRAAILTATGQQQDKYQGLQVNLQPLDAQLGLFYVNAGSMVTTLGDTQIRVIDDNLDGVYGSPPKSFAYPGLSKETYQPDMDSVVIGSSSRALPWSELMQIEGSWYRMEPVNSGLMLSATPMEVETGTLVLSYDGPPPAWMIVHGEGSLEGCYFDLLAEGKSGVEVPVGTYRFFVGAVVKGKKQQVMKALVLPGQGTGSWKVEKDQKVEVELGGPFGFDFQVAKSADSVAVIGTSVTIVGAHGERYERTWNCAPRPEIVLRKAGSKKGGKGEDMDMVENLNEMHEGQLVYSYADTWRPLDTTVENKYGNEVEVQLVEKKNKLFGKIESTWK